MANDLTSGSGGTIAAVDRLARDGYEAPPRLKAAIELQASGVWLSPAQYQEMSALAEQHLALLTPLTAPASMERILGWLTKLAEGLANAPKGDGRMQAASEALIEDCGELPVGVWVPETRRAFRRVNRFWPGSSELYGHLKPYAEALQREAAGARRIIEAAQAKPAAPVWTPPTEEDKAELSAKLRAAGIPPLRSRAAGYDEDDQRAETIPSTFGRALGAVVQSVADARSKAA